MLPFAITIKCDLRSLKKAYDVTDMGLFKPVYEAWASIYRAEMMERFSLYSRGGGDWPPLAESTIKARRPARKTKSKKTNAKRKVAILMDTGTLFNTLSPSVEAPGQLTELLTNGVRVGIGGEDLHPGGALTIGKLALYHQEGSERLPKRKILVPPSDATRLLMSKAMSNRVKELADNM